MRRRTKRRVKQCIVGAILIAVAMYLLTVLNDGPRDVLGDGDSVERATRDDGVLHGHHKINPFKHTLRT